MNFPKKYTNMIYAVTVILLAIYWAYSKGLIFANFESISPEKARMLIVERQDVVILDVRTPEEYGSGHLKNAMLIPLQELSTRYDELYPFKEKTIIVYCRSGNRSISASRMLSANGYKPLNMNEGIGGWLQRGYEVTKR